MSTSAAYWVSGCCALGLDYLRGDFFSSTKLYLLRYKTYVNIVMLNNLSFEEMDILLNIAGGIVMFVISLFVMAQILDW